MKKTALKRYTPIRKKRATPRRGEPTAAEKESKRAYIYNLSQGSCELTFNGEKLPDCQQGLLPWDGPVMVRWHLVHVRARRRFGWPVEGEYRMRGGCFNCHIVAMHAKGMKPDLGLH